MSHSKLAKGRQAIAAIALFILSSFVLAAPADNVVIEQSLGVDQSVDYASLTELGPWDDRNYQLTQRDLAVLPPKDQYVAGVPAFFKVFKRREMAEQGFPLDRYYPREVDKEFRYRFGGLMQNGVLVPKGLGRYTHPDPNNPPPFQYLATDPIPHAVPIEGEGPFDGTLSDNETTIEFNPVNPNLLIAGSNGSGGQRHAYSSNGGLTWFSAGVLPSSCCDPAMDWSPDGSIAYTATLGNASGASCGGFCTEIYRSVNNGQTWLGPINVSTGSSDKEFIHVDKSPTSPYLGRVYVTWHQGNVMQFARSTQQTPTLTFAATQSFGSEERGIGSDITTDFAGRIYYFWPTVTDNSTEVRVVRSVDGGVTFTPSVQVFDLWGDFDFAVPSMETRRAFIYVSADTDQSNGPHRGRIYVTFTDKHPSSPQGPGGAAASNHSWIQVSYSDDQGATWQTTATPHAVADVATVDRYHPWIDVDDVGNVHIGFYDTRNSTNRTGVDWYYVLSADGGATWQEETRVSAIVSQNITDGQEWGDYNGLSAGPGATVAMTWTDNRITPPAITPVQSSFAGRVTNIGLGPTYVLNAGGGSVAVCAGDPVPQRTITVTPLNSYANPVTLSLPGLNATVFPTSVFGTNPVPPPGTSTLNLATAPGTAAGTYNVTVRGTGPGPLPGDPAITRDGTFSVVIDAPLVAAVTLAAPANAAVDQPLRPTLSWTALAGTSTYTVEVATDAAFANIIATADVAAPATSFVPAANLLANTQYFWRVTAGNGCGDAPVSLVRSFTTANLYCSAGALSIPDNVPTDVTQDIVIPPTVVGNITALSVSMNITHTYLQDLQIVLSKVGGGSTRVFTRPITTTGGACSGNNATMQLNDAAATGAQNSCVNANTPALTGSLRPQDPFSVYAGTGYAGTWRVAARDVAGQDVGTIDIWCISAPPPDTGAIFRDGFE